MNAYTPSSEVSSAEVAGHWHPDGLYRTDCSMRQSDNVLSGLALCFAALCTSRIYGKANGRIRVFTHDIRNTDRSAQPCLKSSLPNRDLHSGTLFV